MVTIATHCYGIELSVQFIFSRNIYIACCINGTWYLYPHDELRDLLVANGKMTGTTSWDEKGGYSWPRLSDAMKVLMERYALQ